MARTEVTGRQIKDKSVSLADDVVDTLPVTNGGTGTGTLSAGAVLVGGGTGAVTTVAPGTSGYVLTSNGSTWVSAAAAAGEVTLNGAQTLYNKTISGASNTLTDIPVSAVPGAQATSQRGQANGYASLDANGQVPLAQFPAGAYIDNAVRVDDSVQFYAGATTVGGPVSLVLAEIDGGTPTSTSQAFVDGGTV